MTIGQALCFFAAWLLCGVCFNASADPVQNLFARIDSTLSGEPLPTLEDVVPGYAAIEPNRHGFVVGQFRTEPGNRLPWGVAVSWIIRDRLGNGPRTRLYMPSAVHDVMETDGNLAGASRETLLFDKESLHRISERLGISAGMTGSIEIHGENFSLDTQLLDLKGNRTISNDNYAEALDQLPRVIDVVVASVNEHLGVDPVADELPLTVQQIAEFARLISLWQRLERQAAAEVASALLDDQPAFGAAAVAYLQIPDFGKDAVAQNEFVLRIADRFPEHGGVQTAALRRMTPENRLDVSREKLGRLRDLVHKDSGNWMAAVLLAEFLAEHGYERDSVLLSRELVRRRPNNYRAWWNLAYSLQKLAWYYRGSDFWANVPERDRRLFTILLDLAGEATDQAIAMNEDEAGLWHLKMDMNPGYNSAMLAAYDRAVVLDPHNYFTYDYALNYASPSWGGSYGAQIGIYEEAVLHNPDVTWTDDLYSKHIRYETKLGWAASLGCGPRCQQNIREILLILFLVLVALFGFIRYRRNRFPEYVGDDPRS